MIKTRRLEFFALYSLICMIWGSTWLVIRIGDEAALPPFLGASLRFVLAAILLWIWVWVRKIPLPRTPREVRVALVSGLLGAGTSYSIVYWCSQFIPSGLESVIFGTMPLWTVLIGTFVLRYEKLSIVKLAGVLTGVMGIAIIFYPEMKHVSGSDLSVLALLLCAPLVTAITLVVTKKDGRSIHPVALNAVSISIGAVIVSILAAFNTSAADLHFNVTQLWTVGYLALFGTVISFVVYYKLLHSTAAVTMAYVTLISPVIAVLLGWLVLHEHLSGYDLAGSAAVLTGVWLTSRQAKAIEGEAAAQEHAG